MNKLFRNKKAVSPVIAAVLMILVTMIGMTLLFGFVSSYSDSYKKGIGSSVMESISIEDIYLSPDHPGSYDNKVNITVYNSGKIDSTISSSYVNGLKLTYNNNLNTNKPIAVGQHVTLNLKWDDVSNWNSGQEYNFKISTVRGSNYEQVYRAP
jgi:flagellin-like protein